MKKSVFHISVMKWVLLVLAISGSINAASAVEFLGRFSHEGWTEEHRYIYRLDLWREGEKLFGFYAFSAGLQGDRISGINSWRIAGSLKGKTVLLKGEQAHFSFSGNLSESTLSGRWSDSMTSGMELTLQKLPAAETEPALLRASLVNYEAWAQWAEQYLDSKDVKDKQLSQYITNCTNGDGTACLAAGNHSKLRGNHERARQSYEAGCNLNNPSACLFVGREERAREILKSRCTGQVAMENNFACKALGELEEKTGHLAEAKEWYRKGCNDSIPKVCPDFKRLDNP